MPTMKSVVIVEDDVIVAMHMKKLCQESGTLVLGVAHDSATARGMILAGKPDYVLMDLRLGEQRDGVDIAQDVLGTLPETKFIFVTGSAERLSIARIESVKPKQIFIKPVEPKALRKALS